MSLHFSGAILRESAVSEVRQMRSGIEVRGGIMKILKDQKGAIGWILLWAIGIPIPILLLLFMVRGCT